MACERRSLNWSPASIILSGMKREIVKRTSKPGEVGVLMHYSHEKNVCLCARWISGQGLSVNRQSGAEGCVSFTWPGNHLRDLHFDVSPSRRH